MRKVKRKRSFSAKLNHAVKKYKQFNWKSPKKLTRLSIDLSTPLIRIGEVPELTYISDKTGKKVGYRHRTKKMPVMYGHPNGKFFVIVGGSVEIRDWLYN